jgi:hypothetical protein
VLLWCWYTEQLLRKDQRQQEANEALQQLAMLPVVLCCFSFAYIRAGCGALPCVCQTGRQAYE